MKQFTTALPLALLISMVPLSAYADNGMYGDVFVGSSSYEFDATISGTFEGESFSDSGTYDLGNATSYGLRVGYQFMDFIAIELGYSDFGKADDSSDEEEDTINLTAVTLGVKGILPLTNNFSLNARLGMASWDASSAASAPEADDISESGQDLYYGVGVEYSFGNKFYTGLEYSITNFDLLSTSDGDYSFKIEGEVSNIALSIGYKF